jgi:opacity protein-like surface antigen
MKTRIMILAAALFFSAAVSAEAGFHIGLTGAYIRPLDKNQGGAPAYGLSVGLDLASNLSLDVSVLRYESAVTASTDGLSAGQLAVIPLEIGVDARFPFGDGKLAAWAGVAGGYALPQFTYDSTAASGWNAIGFTVVEKVRSGPCLGMMGGLEYALSSTSVLRLEVRYRLMKASGSWSMADRTGGLTQSGTLDNLNLDTLTLGLTVRIGL